MAGGNWFLGVLKGVWAVLDVIVDLVVLALVLLVVLVAITLATSAPHVPQSAALVIDPQGQLVEQFSGSPLERAVDRATGRDVHPQTRVRDVVDAIRAAETDSRIKALVINADDMDPAPLATLQAITDAVKEFKTTRKPVFAVAESSGQSQYYLDSFADKVMLHPEGSVIITGFGAYREYFKDALDKLAADWNVFRVGKYKSYVEPFTRNDMSPAAKEADKALLDVLWQSYQQGITDARHLKAGAVAGYADDAPANLAAVDGDTAQMALDHGLVDKLATRDEMNAAIGKVAGPGNEGSFSQIGFLDYLRATGAGRDSDDRNPNQVGVIVAEGDILAGDQPPGAIGGESLSRLIRRARFDSRIKALVLRVDSPGGSAFASDLILHQIELTKSAGKPVVVSMGAVAASGGYWISMAGDRIFARPTTITGSIGILGMFPTFQKSLAKLGVHNDGIGTSALSGDFLPTRAMSDAAKKIFQLTIDHGYHEFVTKVAKARNLSVDQVKEIAQGRVWSGQDARRIGLIDEFGGLSAATKAAAQLAGIADGYSVRYIEPPLGFGSRFLMSLTQRATASFGPLFTPPGSAGALQVFDRLRQAVKQLARFNDPHGVYAYCFCRGPLER